MVVAPLIRFNFTRAGTEPSQLVSSAPVLLLRIASVLDPELTPSAEGLRLFGKVGSSELMVIAELPSKVVPAEKVMLVPAVRALGTLRTWFVLLTPELLIVISSLSVAITSVIILIPAPAVKSSVSSVPHTAFVPSDLITCPLVPIQSHTSH